MSSTPTLLVIIAIALTAGLGARMAIAKSFAGTSVEIAGKHVTGKTQAVGYARLIQSMERLGRLSPAKALDVEDMRAKLTRAGLHIEAATWRGVQIACAGIGVLLGAAMLMQRLDGLHLFFCVLIALLGSLGPSLVVSSLTRDRQRKIESSMASTLELLSITVRSGYPLERSLRLVSTTTSGPLSEEFKQVDTDVNLLGMSLPHALRRMSDRCQTPSVSSFCSALSQASQQGTSISRVLDAQAKMARNEHYTTLQEQVNKLPAKLVAPIFAIMALVIVIALVPPIYETIQVFSGSVQESGAFNTNSSC